MEKTSRRRKYIGKHVKPTDENIMQLLMPSILGMLICMVCLAGATWAWFTATTTVSVPPVSAAYFDVQVTIGNDLQTPESSDSEHMYTIDGGENYKIELTATGNASIGGYCVITIGENTYYTPWMSIENSSEGVRSISFNLYTDKEEKIKIIPYWGTPSSIDSDHKITNGMQIGTLPQATDGEDFEAPGGNTGGAVNIGGGETGGGSDNATNNDNADDHKTLQSEQPPSHPENEGKGDSSDNNEGSTSDSANTALSASDNTVGGSHDSGSGGDSDSSSSGGGGGSGSFSSDSGSGGDNADE